MAIKYIDDTASGANDGTSWDDAWTTFGAATFTGGDFVLVNKAHSEASAGAAITINGPSSTSPCTIISCTTDTATYAKATATWLTTGAGNYDMTFNGAFNIYGGKFSFGNDFKFYPDADEPGGTMDDCHLVLANQSFIRVSGGSTKWINCTYELGTTTSYLWYCASSHLYIRGGTLSGTVSGLGSLISSAGATVFIDGFDLSGTSSTCEILFTGFNHSTLKNLKLPATFAGISLTGNGENTRAVMYGSDDTTNNLSQYESWHNRGTVKNDKATYRTGGANDGLAAYSLLMDSGAECDNDAPLQTEWVTYHYPDTDTTPSYPETVAITSYLTSDTAGLTDEEVWMEVSYLDDDGATTSAFSTSWCGLTDMIGTDSSPSTLTSDTSGWTAAKSSKYKITISGIAIDRDGPLLVRWMLGKASESGLYICPLVDIVTT